MVATVIRSLYVYSDPFGDFAFKWNPDGSWLERIECKVVYTLGDDGEWDPTPRQIEFGQVLTEGALDGVKNATFAALGGHWGTTTYAKGQS